MAHRYAIAATSTVQLARHVKTEVNIEFGRAGDLRGGLEHSAHATSRLRRHCGIDAGQQPGLELSLLDSAIDA